jgi:hypothetical protein
VILRQLKFYYKKSFKDLHARWRKRLADKGFNDLEDHKGRLKTPDIRTALWKDKEEILLFFLALDTYLSNTSGIPRKHRKILELYSSGMEVKDIAKIVKEHRQRCHEVIALYRKEFLYE